MTKSKITKQASYLTVAFATAAFIQSGATLAEMAVTYGGYDPILAWITPLLIDGALVQLGITRVALGRKSPKWLALTIWAAIALSVALNVLGHGPMGAIAPIMLAVSFESWVRLMETPAASGARTKARKARKV